MQGPGGASIEATAYPMPLPLGHFPLDAELDDQLRADCGASPRRDGTAHPAMTFVAALGGAGLPVADILARCGCSIEAGPLLAACDLDWARPLQVSAVYQIAGAVTSKRRKPSRRFGSADHLALDFAISRDGELHATVRLSMIVPVPTS